MIHPLIKLILVVALWSAPTIASADWPTYVILQRPGSQSHHRHGGYVVPSVKNSYAWGYFGAQAGKTRYWQRAYYHNLYDQKTVTRGR